MRQTLYNLTIAPRLQDPNLKSREIVLNVMLIVTFGAIVAAFTMQTVVFIMQGLDYLLPRMTGVAAAAAAVAGIYHLSRSGAYWPAAGSLIALYFILSLIVVLSWGTLLPTGILLCGLVIVMAGILLGARFSLLAALAVMGMVGVVQYANQAGLVHPNLEWMDNTASIGDSAGPLILFGVMAAVSWLFNYQMEHSLRRAYAAEVALLRQKEELEEKIKERTRELQAAQFEKMQQIYRFAELGQLSTGLLHELANHMTILSLDIETLESQQKRSRLLARAKRTMRYIDDMIKRVRDQLRGKSPIKSFHAFNEIAAIIQILHHKANLAGVSIIYHPHDQKVSCRCEGDPIRFRQIVANVISNAIDASSENPDPANKKVEISNSPVDNSIIIRVKDRGKGIAPDVIAKIFEPFYSTKKTGLGMGLYITRQLVVGYFGGTIDIESGNGSTEFIISIPQKAPHASTPTSKL